MKAIINAKIYDYLNYIENGYIIYSDKIEKVGEMKDFAGCEEVLDVKGAFVLPSLVNFHTHIYSQLFRGMSLDANPTTFLELLEQVWWKFDSKLNIEDIRQSAESFCEESLLNGVTSIIDHHASGVIEGTLETISKAVEGYGMKGLYCFETSDRFDVDECIRENSGVLFGLHANMSLSDDTLRKVSAELRGRPIHVHVLETKEDNPDSVGRLDFFGLLNRDSLLAHCVHISEEDAKVIADRGCNVALNPSSNMNNAVGSFNLGMMKRNGINILAGTDGLGVNVAREWMNIYYVGRQKSGLPGEVGLSDIEGYIRNGYEVFSRLSGKKVGKMAEGYASDFMLVDYKPPTIMSGSNIFGHVFFGVFDTLRPSDVFTNGNRIINNYRLIDDEGYDPHVSWGLWERIGEDK